MKNRKLAAVLIILAIVLLLCFSCGTERPVPPAASPEITAAPEPVPTPAQKSEEELISEAAEALLASMTPEERLYQLFVVLPDELPGVSDVTVSDESVRAAIEKCPVGGIIYSSPSLISRQQTADMISGIQSYSRLGLFITLDEEGGSVARLGNNPDMGTTAFPAMTEIGDTGDTQNAYNVGLTVGREIKELGFNLDFAPVADVNSNPQNTVIGSRAFGTEPDTVAAMVRACVEGFSDSGALCTLKHFPGHGDTYADSHYGEAEIKKTLAELYECELIPFRAGIDAGADLVMIGHISLPNATDDGLPATLSHEIVTELLRDELGFEGIVITDAMGMKAISDRFSSGEAAVMAIKAGCDMILSPEDLTDAVSGLSDALSSGGISQSRIDESVLRILKLKLQSGIIEMP